MTEAQARIKIWAAAYAVAAELGTNKAAELLKQAVRELEASQWEGPGSR